MTAIAFGEDLAQRVQEINESGRAPVVFVHGLWLLASSWDRWTEVFEQAGYATLSPGWPADPDTVEAAHEDPEVFANKGVGQVADHYERIIATLERKPALVGHSFGGLIVQMLAGRGVSAATVAIDPAPFRGVLPVPVSSLRSSLPVLGNPANRHRAIPLTYDEFRYAFANAVAEDEAKQLYDTFAVPAPGKPLFQAVAANINPATEVKAATKTDIRGPLLIISGEKDHTIPWALANGAFKRQRHNIRP